MVVRYVRLVLLLKSRWAWDVGCGMVMREGRCFRVRVR